MLRSDKMAVALGVVSALCWSPHFHLFNRLRTEADPPPVLVLSFYFVLGAAGALLLFMFLTGRLPELRAFKRRETRFLLLAGLGGYAFWMLRGVALRSLDPSRARLLFYTAPLLMGVFSLFSREKMDGRLLVGLVLGLIGCIMLTSPAHLFSGPLRPVLVAVGAAACWALFSLAAVPLAREENVLPVAALVLGIGALCLFINCLSTVENIFAIRPGALLYALGAGALTIGLMMVFWLKCLGAMSAPLAGGLWYLGLVFGVFLSHLVLGGPAPNLWWTLGGTTLVLLGLHSALSGRRRQALTLSDIIRGS